MRPTVGPILVAPLVTPSWSSTYHAVIIAAAALYVVFASPAQSLWSPTATISTTTRISNASLGFSLGYFVFDLVLMLRYFPWVRPLHH